MHRTRLAVLTLSLCALAPALQAQELVPPTAADAPRAPEVPVTTVDGHGDGQSQSLAPAEASEPASTPESAPAPAASADALAEPEPADAAADSVEPSAAVFSNAQVANLKVQLQVAEAERDSTNPLWPRLAVGAGLGASLLATAVGAAYALDCDGECSAPTWVSFVVVAGAAVGVLSTIWLIRTDSDRAQLELRKRHIEYELERWNQAALQRQRWHAQTGPQLSLRFAL
jgi:hypothetical protein